MNLPFRRRSRPRGQARLALTGDFNEDGYTVTEMLEAAGPSEWDGTTIEFTGVSVIGLPAPASFPALPARTPQHHGRRPDARPDDGTWDRSPQALRAAAGALREQQPPPRPPAIRPLPPELPPYEGLPAAQVTAMLGAIRYPRTDGTPEDYAAVMRRWSHLTGTASGLESPGAWPRHAIAGATHRTAAS